MSAAVMGRARKRRAVACAIALPMAGAIGQSTASAMPLAVGSSDGSVVRFSRASGTSALRAT